MSRELVSVIVPTYNRAYCLGRTIDSALSQTHPQVEVIVVDDGSTDATREMIAARYGSEPRVRYHFQKNQGVSVARNTGFELAQGEFVALLDSDDVWKPWKLELQLACMRRFPEVGMVWTDMEAIDPGGEVFDARYIRTMYYAYRWFENYPLFERSIPLSDMAPALAAETGSAAFHTGDLYARMFMGSLVHTSTVLMRHDRLKSVGFFDPELDGIGEDYDFHWRTAKVGPIGFVDLSTILYQRGMPDRLTTSKHGVHGASNALKVVTRELSENRARIDLPGRFIRGRMAYVHVWLAEALLNNGRRAEARTHLYKSMRYVIPKARTLRLLTMASLPIGLTQKLQSAYRSIKTARQAAV
jgi:GT2 family glycosyltransferase